MNVFQQHRWIKSTPVTITMVYNRSYSSPSLEGPPTDSRKMWSLKRGGLSSGRQYKAKIIFQFFKMWS